MPKDILGVKFYLPEEVAELCGVKLETAWGYFRNGKIKGQKIGGRWYVSEPNLREFFGITDQAAPPLKPTKPKKK